MFTKIIDDVVSILDRRRRARKIRTELQALSDEELAELGIERQEIRYIAKTTTQYN